ncbi:TetR/AcrR family transcriptional regulator [Streptomyces sp. NPDC057908]|uniref:TetR/AcrR family transcriptional regulator n=1 Tax=Streptomyces sp. NPDC057908 TaxID=3346276 RepID=UPI0036F1485E
MGRPRKFDETYVLAAAMDAFWRQGYEATSTRDLADCTGVGQSSLHNAFGDKHQLYLRALRHYYDTATAEQTALLQRPGPVKDRIRELIVRAIEADLDDPEAPGCFAINASVERASSDPAVKKEVLRHFATVQDSLQEAVARGQSTGEITGTYDARSLAGQVLSTYYGLRVLARVRDDRQSLLNVVDAMLVAL